MLLVVIVLIYCIAQYCTTLVPENAKLIALIALIVTILYCAGAFAYPPLRGPVFPVR
jgi:hypothetical protein